MKFCNLLRESSEELPEIEALFAPYKQLKKTLRQLSERHEQGDVQGCIQMESRFISELNNFIQLINNQFIEKEEECVIEIDNLEERAAKASTTKRCQEVTKQFVDFHGKMLLFIHAAMMGYTAVLKILKKYAKKRGDPIRGFQRERLSQMPVCQTEIASSIVQRAQSHIEALMNQQRSNEDSEDYQESDGNVSALLKRVQTALETWEKLRTTAVTPSTVFVVPTTTMHSIPSTAGSVMSRSSSVPSEGS